MTGGQPVPCPVRLGTVKTGGLPAQLHKCTLERNLHKVEKLLKKEGVDVDCVNHLGQTPLFCASLLGYTGVAELLLQYGADPNYRCRDRSTPVHAAVFSCNPWLLSELLDAGGDLRVHDDQGRTPRDWAEAGAQEHSPRMLDFLKRCVSHMQNLSQTQYPRYGQVSPGSSKTLLRSPSLLELLRPGGSDLLLNKKLSTKSVCDMVQCFGYGKLCVEKARQPVGLLASVPLIGESELGQAEDEALHSFTCGPFSRMTNYSWRGCRVSVKELQTQPSQQSTDQDGCLDLLITELEFCCRLFHPHLLQLMAVSMSSDLQQSKLVYERVHMDSLYGLLYHRRAEFPVLQVWEVLGVVLQVCEALLYLQGRALVLRGLSSHGVLIVHPGVAKVTGLGFMVPSEECRRGNGPPVPLPAGLYNWAAPEAIRRRACTGKADLYSFCTLIQEIYTDAVPWGSVDPRCIKQAVDAGQALCADAAVPQPYYTLLQIGLHPRAEDRTCSLQDLRYMLRSDLQELSRRERRVGVRPVSAGLNTSRWSSGVKRDRESEVPVQPRVELEQEFQDQLQQLDCLLEKEMEEKNSQSSPGGVQSDETESSTYYEALHPDISYRDILPLEDWRLTLPISSSEADSSEDLWSSSSIAGEHLATRVALSSSEHISSIVLNLKVSQVLLQQVESSLECAELGLEGGTHGERSHSLTDCCDEVDGVGMRSESGVLVLKAVGPPSTYTPQVEGGGAAEGPVGCWEALGTSVEEQVSQYCSAGEESFSSNERDRGVSRKQQGGDRHKPGLRSTEQTDRSYDSSHIYEPQERATPRHVHLTSQTKPMWTSEVREVVALMTKGRLGTPARPTDSSESEDIEDQLPLLVRQDPLGHSNSQNVLWRAMEDHNPQHSPDLEHMFKSPAVGGLSSPTAAQNFSTKFTQAPVTSILTNIEGMVSRILIISSLSPLDVPCESEASTDFHTVSHAVSPPSGPGEEKRHPQTDCTQSPVEASSMFYTPEHETDETDVSEEDSQTLSSEEDVDVTMEVCRATMTVADSPVVEVRARELQPGAEERTVAVPSASGQGCLPYTRGSHTQDLADLDELSSITCSPGQPRQWAGQDGFLYSPNSRGFPPRNSTPRSPGTHTGRGCSPCHGKEEMGRDPLLHLQGAVATPPSGSACTGAYTTASLGDSHRADPSKSSVLQCPEVKKLSQEERETPTAPVSSETKHIGKCSAQTHSQQTHTTPGGAEQVEAHGEASTSSQVEEEEVEESVRGSCASGRASSRSSTPSPDAAPTRMLAAGLDEDDVLHEEEEECEEQSDPEDHRESFEEELFGMDKHWAGVTQGAEMEQHSEGSEALQETQRAHTSLDRILDEVSLGESVESGSAGQPQSRSEEKRHDAAELREESGCPAGDNGGMAAGKGAEPFDEATSANLTGNVNEQGETLETANHIAWKQPHRVIVLEHTPVRTQSETAQVLSTEAAYPP